MGDSLGLAVSGLSTQAAAWYNAVSTNTPVNTAVTSTSGLSSITASSTLLIILLLGAALLAIFLLR
jgi:hypothetical protein